MYFIECNPTRLRVFAGEYDIDKEYIHFKFLTFCYFVSNNRNNYNISKNCKANNDTK